ncbi:MAG: DUF2029 domain-containing protein [Sphingomonadales bacterium]|nr:DUF2029 domain-containing protein [Sphingomonadales bacterium]
MGLDFFRRADWFDAARARGYLWALALIDIATLAFLLATSRGGIDRNGFLLGTDFLSFWTTGQMLHAHANIYDAAAHTAAQRGFFAAKDAYTAFFYPPTFLPFCWPLGLLGYFPALALWLAATGAAYLFAVRQWMKRVGLAQPLPLLFAAFPPVLIAITHGQTAFLVAALLGLGTLLVPSRPWLAGVLLGLATIKPQFGLLVPVALLLTREWRVIAGAMLSAALLGAVSTLAFDSQIWADWYHLSSAAQGAMAEGAIGYAKMQSPFAAAKLLGAPSGIAYALQGLLTLAVAGAVAWASWGRRFDLPLAALLLAGAPLATPFVLDYDMVLLAFPLIWLAGQMIGQGFGPWDKLVFAATFAAAAFARPLALAAGIPIMPVILVAFFAVTLRRVRCARTWGKGGDR